MRSIRLVFVAVASVALVGVAPFGKKAVNAPIRLIPELKWEASPRPISISSENNSDHEKAEEFVKAADPWIVKAHH